MDAALRSLETASKPSGIVDRLEAAGFGRRTRPSADDVLTRLRQKASNATTPAQV
jgi:hypothetical protein